MEPESIPLTDEARQFVAAAHGEAARLGHEYFGTEHLAFALTRHAQGVIVAALRHLGVDLDAVRRSLEDTVRPEHASLGPATSRPYTSRTRRVFGFATEYARAFGEDAVGVEHVVLGLLRERMNIGAQVLAHHGLSLEATHAALQRLSGSGSGAC